MKDKAQRISDWVTAAQQILTRDKGARTILKRAAGTPLASANGSAIAEFYKIPSPPAYLEEQAFAVLCIMCLWKPEEWKRSEPLIKAAKKVLSSDIQENFGKKITALMDLSIDKDGYFLAKLFRMIKYAKSKGAIVDASQLLYDLSYWENEQRFIQRRWVKEFYQKNNELENEGETKNAD